MIANFEIVAMVLTLEQYNYIYSLLLEHSCSATNLQTLKERFREDINSQRTFETITSINSLWKVLEKRDVLGPEHEDRLRIIVNEIVPNNQRVLEIMYGTYGGINVALQNKHPIPSTRQENLNQRGKVYMLINKQNYSQTSVIVIAKLVHIALCTLVL